MHPGSQSQSMLNDQAIIPQAEKTLRSGIIFKVLLNPLEMH